MRFTKTDIESLRDFLAIALGRGAAEYSEGDLRRFELLDRKVAAGETPSPDERQTLADLAREFVEAAEEEGDTDPSRVTYDGLMERLTTLRMERACAV